MRYNNLYYPLKSFVDRLEEEEKYSTNEKKEAILVVIRQTKLLLRTLKDYCIDADREIIIEETGTFL